MPALDSESLNLMCLTIETDWLLHR